MTGILPRSRIPPVIVSGTSDSRLESVYALVRHFMPTLLARRSYSSFISSSARRAPMFSRMLTRIILAAGFLEQTPILLLGIDR
jgi:hypothetical protein